MTTVVCLSLASAQALRDSGLGVRVDRARRLDEHEHLGVGEERSREHEPLALTAREGAAPLVDVRVQTLGQRLDDVFCVRDGDRRVDPLVVSVRALPRVELAAQRAREDDRVRFADDDSPANRVDRELGERHVAEVDAVVVPEAAEPVGNRGSLVGLSGDEPDQAPRLDAEPRAVIMERDQGRGLGHGTSRLGNLGLDLEDPEHAGRADVRTRQLVDGLGRGPQREHEEGRVPVEGHELARVDLPLQREAGSEPRDQDDEEPGDEHLGGVERRLGKRDAHACLAHLLRACAVAREERLLPADSRSTRRPAAVSAPSAVSLPTSSRCTA